ncbi:MAG: alkaline phosphatase family protein [Candidatus Krumholzibacteriia bacterium]
MTVRPPRTASRLAGSLAGRRIAAALLLLPLIAGSTGCGGESGKPAPVAPRSAVILGFDALDWQVLEPLIEAGQAPTFARLRDEGASGVCLSFVPLQKSPLIWASIATGLEPAAHGIGGFVKPKPGGADALSAAADWRAPAIWDLAGAADLSSCVIGWWVTFPARAIAGVLVSDHVTYTAAGNRNPAGLVQPADLAAELSDLTVSWDEVPLDLLRIMLPGATDEMLDPSDSYLHRLRLALAGDLTYLATARHLLARGDYDFFAVYFRGLDLACHTYWKYHDPGDGPEQSEEDRARYGNIVPGYYQVLDRWLAELLPLLRQDANLVIVSDHGFHGPRRDRQGTFTRGVAEHRPEGVLMIRSPLYTPGARFTSSHVLDVAPTTLALLGVPPSQEMPGQILRENLTAPAAAYVEYLDANRIASYALLAPAPPPEVADDPAVDAAVRRQLRSLGYVD